MPIKLHRSTSKVMHRAVDLRKKPTPAEAKLWEYLRRKKLYGLSFRRQHAIGKYIVDFCCPHLKLVIELDGGHHLSQEEYDEERTRYLKYRGYRVLRFWNDDVVNNIDGVVRVIMQKIPVSTEADAGDEEQRKGAERAN